MITVQELRAEVIKRQARRGMLINQIKDKNLAIDGIKHNVEVATKARWIIAENSRVSQDRLVGYVESLVTMAIRSVYDRPFHFLVDFRISRNKSECFLMVYEGEEKSREEMIQEAFFPEDEEGGGLLDIISLALRVVIWSLGKPQRRSSIWQDEPLKNLGALRPLAVKLLRRIAADLGLQFVIITHEEELAEIADKAWTVVHRGGVSIVTQTKGEKTPVPIPSARRVRRVVS